MNKLRGEGGKEMKSEEYEQLERLLGKLRGMLGAPFCIVPECVQDLYHIATYGPDGKLNKQSLGIDIQDAVQKLNNHEQ